MSFESTYPPWPMRYCRRRHCTFAFSAASWWCRPKRHGVRASSCFFVRDRRAARADLRQLRRRGGWGEGKCDKMMWHSQTPQMETRDGKKTDVSCNLDLGVIGRRGKRDEWRSLACCKKTAATQCLTLQGGWMYIVFKTRAPPFIRPLTNTSSHAPYIVAPFTCSLACSCFSKF